MLLAYSILRSSDSPSAFSSESLYLRDTRAKPSYDNEDDHRDSLRSCMQFRESCDCREEFSYYSISLCLLNKEKPRTSWPRPLMHNSCINCAVNGSIAIIQRSIRANISCGMNHCKTWIVFDEESNFAHAFANAFHYNIS